MKTNSSKPSENLRYLSIGTLLKIRGNNYQSVYYKNHLYDKEAIDTEIERKIKNKKFIDERRRRIYEAKI